jgi:hypothetical protein
MVHHSSARINALINFIIEHTKTDKSTFQVSDVKRDGTVFVKFRSSSTIPALFLAECFNRALWSANMQFTQTTDVQFRLSLDQFCGEKVVGLLT